MATASTSNQRNAPQVRITTKHLLLDLDKLILLMGGVVEKGLTMQDL